MKFRLVENANVIFETESFKEFENHARLELKNFLSYNDIPIVEKIPFHSVLHLLEENEVLTYFNHKNIKFMEVL